MLTSTTITFGIIGLMISSLIKLAKLKKRKEDFSLGFWIEDNWMQNVATVLMIFVLLYFAPTIATGMLQVEIMADSQFYEMFALGAGFSNHAMFHDMMKVFKK